MINPPAFRPPFPQAGSALGPWVLHQATEGADERGSLVRFDPPVPVKAMRSLLVWSENLEQWVMPTLFQPRAGQWWVTLKQPTPLSPEDDPSIASVGMRA